MPKPVVHALTVQKGINLTHATLFLGAGFSCGLGLPLMSNFPRYVERHPRLSKEEKGFVRQLQILARDAKLSLELSETNLEDMLSVAVMRELTGADGGQDGEAGYAARARSVLRRSCIPGGYDILEKFPIYTSRLSKIINKDSFDSQSDNHLTIITTNYDVVAEFALHSIGLTAFAPGVNVSSGRPCFYREGASNVTLCKLHGSANWRSPDLGCIECDDYLHPSQIVDKNHSSQNIHLPRSWVDDLDGSVKYQ